MSAATADLIHHQLARWSVTVLLSHRTDLATAAAAAGGDAWQRLPVSIAVESNLSLLVLSSRPITDDADERRRRRAFGGRRTRDAGLMTKGGDTPHPSRRPEWKETIYQQLRIVHACRMQVVTTWPLMFARRLMVLHTMHGRANDVTWFYSL